LVSKADIRRKAQASRDRVFPVLNFKTALVQAGALFLARKLPPVAAMVGAPTFQPGVNKLVAGTTLKILKQGGSQDLAQVGTAEIIANILRGGTPIVDRLLGRVIPGQTVASVGVSQRIEN